MYERKDNIVKKLLFVYNQLAGKGLIRSNLCEIIDIFTKAGYEVTAYPTQAPLDGYNKIKNNAINYDLIVASGGDGTLSEAVQGMMEQPEKIPLGYIPSGSTNDFANSMGIPTKNIDAAKAIVNGVYFDYDVGEFNGKYYVYVAGFGAFTDVSYKTSQNAKNVFGHMAYVGEALKRLPSYASGYDIRIEHDGEVIEDNFMLGLVTNTISVAGIRKLISNGVCFDDGLFEITLVKTPTNPLAWQSLLADAALKKYSDKHFVTFKSSNIKFISKSEIAWTLDGEAGGHHKEVEIANHKQAVRFVVLPDDKTAEQLLINAFDTLELPINSIIKDEQCVNE